MKFEKGTKAKDMIAELQKDIANVKTTEEFTKYMKFIAKFHNYSLNNQLLIQMQKPDAALVKGFNQWKKLGRYPNKNTGIKILAPCPYKTTITNDNGDEEEVTHMWYKVVCVFDVSDTEGDPLPEYNIEIEGDSDFGENLSALCSEYSIDVKFSDTGSAYGVSRMGLVEIKEDSSQATQVATWIHEIGHEKLHGVIERMELSKRQKEFEAECVAYIVCSHFNLPQNSAKYLATYGDYDLMSSLEQISNVASDIINRLESIKADTN